MEGIVDEVLGTLNLLQMIIGVIEGQIRGGYFPDYILDPSVIDCIGQASVQPEKKVIAEKNSSTRIEFLLNCNNTEFMA